MSGQGVTITEAGLLDVLLIGLLVIMLTYPLSLLLMATGIMKTGETGIFFRANEIVRTQILGALFAWIIGAFLCHVALFAVMLIMGFFVWIGFLEPVTSLISDPMLLVFLVIHLGCQGVAYWAAVNDTKYLVDKEA